MVGAALTGLILTLLLGIFSGVLDTWTQTSARTDAFGEARAALHLIDRDLDGVVPAGDSPLVSTKLPNPGKDGMEAFGFVSRVSPTSQPATPSSQVPPGAPLITSDICGIVYYLAPSSAGTNAPLALFRRLVPSKSTFGLLADPPNFFTSACAADAATTLHVEDEVVAQNVVSCSVLMRDADYKVISTTPPPEGTPVATPAYVEIELRVIGSHTAQSYFDAATSDVAKENLLLKNARSFVMRHRL